MIIEGIDPGEVEHALTGILSESRAAQVVALFERLEWSVVREVPLDELQARTS